MIRLVLLSPNGVLFDEDVLSFTVQSKKGPLQINGGYTPIFEMVEEASVLKIDTGKKKIYYAIFHSSLRVTPMKALLSCTHCEEGYDIDTARANESKIRAEKRLERKEEGVDVARAKASLARALIRLEVKSLSEGH